VVPDRAAASQGEEGAFREGYRLLRAALGHCWPEGRGRALVVTSTAPGEGKTLTSVNLARALAAAGERTLLIDADLRKPQGHDAVGARRAPGLLELMAGDSTLEEAIQPLGGGLDFMGSGSAVTADLLTKDRIAPVLAAARPLYRWVVIDTSPVGAVADALVTAPAADGVLVVTGAETVPRAAVRRTLERLAESGARVLGVVLNRARVDRHAHEYQHHYGHGYGAYHRAPAPPAPEIAPLKQRVAP
jgi:capsular exopolysaccharide synthesis family protein